MCLRSDPHEKADFKRRSDERVYLATRNKDEWFAVFLLLRDGIMISVAAYCMNG